jgi:hypothetical protein
MNAGSRLCERKDPNLVERLTEKVWWFTPVFPALRRLRQGDQEFQTSLGYLASLSQRNQSKKKKKKKPRYAGVGGSRLAATIAKS